MSGIVLFAVGVLGISLLAISIYIKRPIKYFKSNEGKGVLFGIVSIVALAVVVALLSHCTKSNALEYLDSGEIFVGLDSTRKISPLCDSGPNSDSVTSNVGARVSLVRSDDKTADISFKYTHHSCAFNPDNRSYDAGGVEVSYKIW